MDIDKARRHDLTLGVNLVSTRAVKPADRSKLALVNGDVTFDAGPPRAIENDAVANNEIKTCGHGVGS
jgi:hypothetical protein